MNYKFLEGDSQFSKSINEISKSDFYRKLTPELGYQHKIGHIQKVMLLAQIIAQSENIDEEQTRILLASAAFHDSGRTRDRDNGEHGESSAKIAGEYFRKNQNNQYGVMQSEVGIVQVAIAYHVIIESTPRKIDEKKLAELCYKYDVNISENFEKVKTIATILKDSDALDRTRFSSKTSLKNNLNPELLRTKTAKQQSVIELARKVNQIYAGYMLRENYHNKQVVQGDNAKTLQFLRHDYKTKNGGICKKEKEPPIEIVKLIFKESLKDIRTRDKEQISENTLYNRREKDELEL